MTDNEKISPSHWRGQGGGFSWDPSQQRVLRLGPGYHLVLAPPGCGKTQILAERIRLAHAEGIDYQDMLCLTFTNRAARGMQERMAQTLQGMTGVDEIFVGNIHRFCSRFLFDSGLVAAGTSIIDEDDALSILSRILDQDEYQIKKNSNLRRQYNRAMQISALVYQIEHDHPTPLWMHADCLEESDTKALKLICQFERSEYNAKAIADIYRHVDLYRDLLRQGEYPGAEQPSIDKVLQLLALASGYEKYKKDNQLLDFEDLLLLAYDAYNSSDAQGLKKYRWIQIDEVQDLNPMQLAITDLITDHSVGEPTVVYLGDEQQAIFSFMGAKMSTLVSLKKRCADHIYHLEENHRAPQYLLEMLNVYAHDVLHTDAALLPKSKKVVSRRGSELSILGCETKESEMNLIADRAKQWLQKTSKGTMALIVNSNADAEMLSERLMERGTRHFKVSGNDFFSTEEMKAILAHLDLLSDDCRFLSWAHVLKGLRVFETNVAARNFSTQCLRKAMLPSDFILYEGQTTYVEQAYEACTSGDVVVFDTETTGLDVLHDDIIQIAAVKLHKGRLVRGSELSLYIRTEREIPQMLGDIVNPILEERKHHDLLDHRDALRRFLRYAKGCVLIGHNVEYDYNILRWNLHRYLPEAKLEELFPVYFDTLKLARLLIPGLHHYKLKNLLAELDLEGQNSHLADEDVNATCSLLRHCLGLSPEAIRLQKEFLSRKRVMEVGSSLRRHYGQFFIESRQRLYQEDLDDLPALIREIRMMMEQVVTQGFVDRGRFAKLTYVEQYLMGDLIDRNHEHCLAQQIAAHSLQLDTMKEADLCTSQSIKERLYLTTIHKAKGLEFDHVVVFDAVDGRIPSYFNRNNPVLVAEDARKFYVAISRAKRSLCVAYSEQSRDYRGEVRHQQLTRFMQPILKFFKTIKV